MVLATVRKAPLGEEGEARADLPVHVRGKQAKLRSVVDVHAGVVLVKSRARCGNAIGAKGSGRPEGVWDGTVNGAEQREAEDFIGRVEELCEGIASGFAAQAFVLILQEQASVVKRQQGDKHTMTLEANASSSSEDWTSVWTRDRRMLSGCTTAFGQ